MARSATKILLATFLAFLSVEILLRAYGWTVPQPERDACTTLKGLSYTGVGDLPPHMNDVWCLWPDRPYRVKTNSLGLRNHEEPKERSFKILALGDSMTFGPYLANEDTWPAWLENELRLSAKSDAIQVFNAGIWGYTITDYLGLLRDKAPTLKPDLVIVAAFDNDISDLNPEKRTVFGRDGHIASSRREILLAERLRSFLGSNLAAYRLASHIKNRLLSLPEAATDVTAANQTAPLPGTSGNQALKDRYQSLVQELLAEAKSQAMPVLFIRIPSFGAAKDNELPPINVAGALAETLGKAGHPYLDLQGAFHAQPRIDELYLLRQSPNGGYAGNGHLSNLGSRIVAIETYKTLARMQLVKPLTSP